MQYRILRQTVIDYMLLPPGWDGHSGEPGRLDSIVDALMFVESLPSDRACPQPMLASDGEVSLYWDFVEPGLPHDSGARFYLEMSFPGDGTYHYIANTAQERAGVDDVQLGTCILHPHLQNLLTRLPQRKK